MLEHEFGGVVYVRGDRQCHGEQLDPPKYFERDLEVTVAGFEFEVRLELLQGVQPAHAEAHLISSLQDLSFPSGPEGIPRMIQDALKKFRYPETSGAHKVLGTAQTPVKKVLHINLVGAEETAVVGTAG